MRHPGPRTTHVCANCGQHPGTLKWSEGVIASLHGAYSWWCEGCALRAQIAHAEERLAALDELRAKLAEWERQFGVFVEHEARDRGAIT